jgi:hypothetical protein
MSHESILRANAKRTIVLSLIVPGLCGALLFAVASSPSWAQPPSSAQQQLFCEWAADLPTAPLEMNTTVVQGMVKTIATEKEIYRCVNTSFPSRPRQGTIDMETFVELVERPVRGGFRTVARRIEVATCLKSRDLLVQPSPRLDCATRTVRLERLGNIYGSCGFTDFPRDPVEMNTVATKYRSQRLVKTIKLDKEILNCDETIVDLFLFTELVEVKSRRGFRPVSKTFEGITCTKPSFLSFGHPRVRCGSLPAG